MKRSLGAKTLIYPTPSWIVGCDGGTRGPADRRITPRAMQQSNGRQYLIAYCFRVRQSSDTGQMSEWSPWHQPVRTTDEFAKPERKG